MTLLRSVFTLVAAIFLSACTHYEPVSLHGAGSLRVEVQVYKGPLSVSPVAQIGQLAAVLGETIRALDTWHAVAAFLQVGCKETETRPAITAPRAHCEYAEHCPDTSDKAVSNYPSPRTQWADCRSLRVAFDSAEDMIGATCYLIHSPSFADLQKLVNLPINTCERYVTEWKYLYDENSLPVFKYRKDFAPLVSDGASPTPLDEQPPMLFLAHTYIKAMGLCLAEWQKKNSNNKDLTLYSMPLSFRQTCIAESTVVALNALATELRSSAFRLAQANVRYVPHDRSTRGLIASYAYLASEYGSLIGSRISLLEKQLARETDGRVHRTDARLLPTGDYLLDSQTSDFVQLYDWLEGARAESPLIDEPGRLNTRERIRMAQRLTSDYYWQTVNQVYASGQGDVSMAFVKNALGNWELKSFSNDPAELLASYRKVTDAAQASAAKLAKRASTGAAGSAVVSLGAAEKAAALATQLAGGATPTMDTGEAADLHAHTAALLVTRGQTLRTREANLKAKQVVEKNKLDELRAQRDAATAEAKEAFSPQIADAEAELKLTERQLKEVPADAVASLKEVLDEHQDMIIARQASLVKSAPQMRP